MSVLAGLFLCLTAAPAQLGENRLANGGFESAGEGWWHPAGSDGGQLERTVVHTGLGAWRYDLTGRPAEVYLSHGGALEPGRDHQVAVWIRCKNVQPDDAISIRVLQFGGGKPIGWYERRGRHTFLHTGGSHDWFQFCFNVPAAALKPECDRLTLFLAAAPEATGTVWFDDATLRPILGEAPAERLDNQPAPPLDLAVAETEIDDAAEFRDIPFLPPVGEGVTIATGSDSNLFYGERPTAIRLTGPGRLVWLVTDQRGRRVDGGVATDEAIITLTAPGYFEVAVKRFVGDTVAGAARTSLHRLPASPRTATRPDYLFGSWVQQQDLLPDLGARWTRIGPGWRYLEPARGQFREALWESTDRSLTWCRANGLEPIYLFTKVPTWAGPHHEQIGPGHWEDFRAYVRRCVERFGDRVDVWEVVNEPYIPDLFPGTNEEIIERHRIVWEEVRRGDPGGRVIGPCLNPRAGHLFRQQRQLLELGLGRWLDGLSLHTYGGLEAGGFLEDLARVRAQLAEFNLELPLYITEQGFTAPETLPLERLQAQYLARMVLLCRQAGVKALIWHMMSWPEGDSAHEREFACVRARTGLRQRAPRPAFAAAATQSLVLGGADFRRTLDLGETVGAQLYERDGQPLYALWEWGRPTREVALEIGAPRARLIDLVGGEREVEAPGGRLTLTITPDPVYVLPLRE